jgi:hypothetical protein
MDDPITSVIPEPITSGQMPSTEAEKPTRSDEEFFRGGLPLDLAFKFPDGKTLKDKLEADIVPELRREIRNHKPRIKKLDKWEKIYRGERSERSYPWPGANSTAPPLLRSRVDKFVVSVIEALTGQQKFFLVKQQDPKFPVPIPEIEDGLDWWTKVTKFKDALYPAVLQAAKSGTGAIYIPFVTKKRVSYRFAGPEESVQNPVLINTTEGQRGGAKEILSELKCPYPVPIDRKDLVWSANAIDVQEAHVIGFRSYKTKPQIEAGITQGFYLKDALKDIDSGDYDDTKKRRANEKGVTLTDGEYKPYEIWQIWTRYDVDGDGEEDDVVLSVHVSSGKILRGIYNEYFSGFRPLVLIKPFPLEYCMDGEGMIEMGEKLQEEKEKLRNQRLDRMDAINAQVVVVRSGSNLDDFQATPGSVWTVPDDPKNCIFPLQMPDVYPSTFTEESLVDQDTNVLTGVSMESMGQSTVERPVAQETMARLEESNKKYKFAINNVRGQIGEVGQIAIEEMAQFTPTYTYKVAGPQGYDQKVLQLPYSQMRDAVKIEVAASGESFNLDSRRQINLTLYQMLKDYNTGMAGEVQMLVNPQVPFPFKAFILKNMQAGAVNMNDIFEDFGKKNKDKLLVDPMSIPGLEQTMQMSMMMWQAQMAKMMNPKGKKDGAPPGQGGQPQPGSPIEGGPGGPPQNKPGETQ